MAYLANASGWYAAESPNWTEARMFVNEDVSNRHHEIRKRNVAVAHHGPRGPSAPIDIERPRVRHHPANLRPRSEEAGAGDAFVIEREGTEAFPLSVPDRF